MRDLTSQQLAYDDWVARGMPTAEEEEAGLSSAKAAGVPVGAYLSARGWDNDGSAEEAAAQATKREAKT